MPPIRLLPLLLLAATGGCAMLDSLAGSKLPKPSDRPVASSLWRQYQEDPDRHPNLPNCSYAGYRYGEAEIPDVKVAVNALKFGAKGDGKTDDTASLRRAIDTAGQLGGGAVLLPAGTYICSGPLFVHDDGVVLRGEGPERTTLLFTRDLQRSYFPNKPYDDDRSGWSWAGGLVWFTPRVQNTFPPVEPHNNRESWRAGSTLTGVSEESERGDVKLVVDNTQHVRAGEFVLLTMDMSRELLVHLAGDVEGAREYNWGRRARSLMARRSFSWPVEVRNVRGNVVTLRQPLRFDVRTSWNPRLVAIGPTIREAGIEGMTIRMKPDQPAKHLEEKGWNGPYFNLAINCWARDLVIENADTGIGTSNSKCMTITRVKTTGREAHHAIACRGSCDVLHYDFAVANEVRHGINWEQLNSGNVYACGYMKHGTFDSHRVQPFESMKTDITIHNDGERGGSDDAGPVQGARCVHWNIRASGKSEMVNDPRLFPSGAMVGVQGVAKSDGDEAGFKGDVNCVIEAENSVPEPKNLYLAQLRLRLGRLPGWCVEPIRFARPEREPARKPDPRDDKRDDEPEKQRRKQDRQRRPADRQT